MEWDGYGGRGWRRTISFGRNFRLSRSAPLRVSTITIVAALAMRTFHRAVTGRISTQTILKAGSMIASAPGRPNYQPVDPSSREFLRAHESKLRGGRALRQPLHISILAITPEASLEPRRHVKLERNDTD